MKTRGTEPKSFRNGRKDRSEIEDVVASVAFIAEEKLRWGPIRGATLADDVVVEGRLGSVGPSSPCISLVMSSITLRMFKISSLLMYSTTIIPPCPPVLKLEQNSSTITLPPPQSSRGFYDGLGSLA
ncbi:hypothetical protein S83_033173 [Arachis hypogaea]